MSYKGGRAEFRRRRFNINEDGSIEDIDDNLIERTQEPEDFALTDQEDSDDDDDDEEYEPLEPPAEFPVLVPYNRAAEPDLYTCITGVHADD